MDFKCEWPLHYRVSARHIAHAVSLSGASLSASRVRSLAAQTTVSILDHTSPSSVFKSLKGYTGDIGQVAKRLLQVFQFLTCLGKGHRTCFQLSPSYSLNPAHAFNTNSTDGARFFVVEEESKERDREMCCLKGVSGAC